MRKQDLRTGVVLAVNTSGGVRPIVLLETVGGEYHSRYHGLATKGRGPADNPSFLAITLANVSSTPLGGGWDAGVVTQTLREAADEMIEAAAGLTDWVSTLTEGVPTHPSMETLSTHYIVTDVLARNVIGDYFEVMRIEP